MDYSDYESYRAVKKSRQNPVEDLSQQNEALPQQDVLNDWDNDFDLNDNICYDEPVLTEEEVLANEKEAAAKEKAAKKAAREKRQMKPTQLANDWKANLEGVKAAFFESMQGGFPKAETIEVEVPTVLCEHHEVKFREVKLYFLHRHLKVKFQECICKPLWKTLLLMHFMPSSLRQPKCAVHFGFLQSIRDRKVIAQDSITSWVEWMNLQNLNRSARDSGEELQPLNQGVLNKSYLVYARLLLSIERTLEEEFLQPLGGIKLAPSCIVCPGSERTIITMDGNFSQKRHKCALKAPEPFAVD